MKTQTLKHEKHSFICYMLMRCYQARLTEKCIYKNVISLLPKVDQRVTQETFSNLDVKATLKTGLDEPDVGTGSVGKRWFI